MAVKKSTLWASSHLVDGFHRPGRPWSQMIAATLLLLALDLLLSVVLIGTENASPLEFSEATDVVEVLRLAKESAGQGRAILLLGDSVLAGEVLASVDPRWRTRRVVDYLDDELGLDNTTRFHQIALNGMLPVDLERIVSELDRIDPAGDVEVVVELNLRYFSPDYAGTRCCTRDWLAALGPPVLDEAGIDWVSLLSGEGRAILNRLGDWIPVYRHRRHLSLERDLSALLGRIDEVEGPNGNVDSLEARARILRHYGRLETEVVSDQVDAFERLLRRLEARGRPGLFFATPLNDQFAEAAMSDVDLGRSVATLNAWVRAWAPTGGRFVSLDHPLFVSELFVDHCHLVAEGNRLLAANLLHELNLPLQRRLPLEQAVYPESSDVSLVNRAASGFSDGAPWQALFSRPTSVVRTDSRTALVTDTGNHALRSVDLYSGIVETVAGSPERRGLLDGSKDSARLDLPGIAWHHENAVFFTDGGGAELRRFVLPSGPVLTEYRLEGPRWKHITYLRSWQDALVVVDRTTYVLLYRPERRRTLQLRFEPRVPGVKALDVAADGRLFLVDRNDRIWTGELAGAEDAGGLVPLTSLFANTGAIYRPRGERTFPLPFGDLRLADVRDIRYVDRYDGLLVQDRLSPTRGDDQKVPTETIHLTFFRLADGLAYPWVKPLTLGLAYAMPNAYWDITTSTFHEGAMDLDQSSASLLYLERNRSRLLLINDGIWGAAKTSHSPFVEGQGRDAFGPELGEFVFRNLAPDRFLDQHFERLARKGPFLGALIGSSLTATSDVSAQYSLGRSLEHHLQRRLGDGDGVRLEFLSRMRPGMPFSRAVEVVEEHVAGGVRLDFLIVELAQLLSRDSDSQLELAERLAAAAAVYDTQVLLFDNTGMLSQRREGLGATPPRLSELIVLLDRLGFEVLRPTDELLRTHLELAPWGSVPFRRNHASPWAIEATAELLAERFYPAIAGHLKGREPSWTRSPISLETRSPEAERLAAVFSRYPDLGPLERVDLGAVQRRLAGRKLTVYVDLTQLGIDPGTEPPSRLRRLALSVLHQFLYDDVAGRAATEVHLVLATFANYDEYGVGALGSAEVVFERTFDSRALEDFVEGTVRTGQTR